MLSRSFVQLCPQLYECGYVRVSHWGSRPGRRHFWRLYWNPEGGAETRLNGVDYPIKGDRLILIPPNTYVEPRQLRSPFRHFFCHFTLGTPYDHVKDTVFEIPLTDEMGRSLNSIISDITISEATVKANDRPMPMSDTIRVLGVMSSALEMIPQDAWEMKRTDARIAAVITQVDKELTKPWTTEELAHASKLSCSSFIRLFKKEVGESPQTYLQNKRLNMSAVLLKTTDMSVEEVAAECGFCDRNYLSKLFKRRFGVGPATYRSTMS